MDYSNSLTCFVDLLGFEATINQSVTNEKIRAALHKNVHGLSADEIKNVLYGQIPFLDGNGKKSTIASAYENSVPDHLLEGVKKGSPLNVTQFSDSYVISCPADNSVSCYFLIQAISAIKLMYFYNLGMLMRGGITIGGLIHEEAGALFGPSLVEAYKLESKKAVYPRILISEDAYEHLSKLFDIAELKQQEGKDFHPMALIEKSFDGFKVIDLISILANRSLVQDESTEITNKLHDIEKDIITNSPDAHPKIAYLLNKWQSHIKAR